MKRKMTIALNIGYETPAGGGILTAPPEVYFFNDFKEFKDMIKNSFIELVELSKERHVPTSSMVLFVTICEDVSDEDYFEWEFKIMMKNVKGYDKFIGLSQEELEKEKLKYQRDRKLRQLID